MSERKKRRAVLWLALTAAVVVAATAGYLRSRAEDGLAVEYQTVDIERMTLAERVTATGTLSPLVTVQVGSQVSGTIKEIFVDFNAHVTRGQIIATIDPRLFEADVARAKANVEASEAGLAKADAELENAKLSYERTSALRSSTLVAESELDASRAAYRSAQAAVKAAQASLSQTQAAFQQAETNLAYTTIVSPIDGVVISRDMDVGQTVAASFQTPTLFTIAEDLRKMEVHTDVAESDVGRVHTGMPVEFAVDAFPRDTFTGTVKEVRYSPKTVQNVVTYDAVVSVANPELKLRPGMTADVAFLVQERHDVLVVPNAALRFHPPKEIADRHDLKGMLSSLEPASAGGAVQPPAVRRIVWKAAVGGAIEPVPISIGISDGRVTEIVAGALTDGDRVILGGGVGADGSDGRENERARFGRFL